MFLLGMAAVSFLWWLIVILVVVVLVAFILRAL